MADPVRPSYAIPSIDQKDQPDIQPVEFSGSINATLDADVSLDDTAILAELGLVVAALVAGMPVTIAGQPIDVIVGNQIDVSGLATQSSLAAILTLLGARVPTMAGTWGYAAGANGSVPLSGSKRVLSVTAVALGAAGSFTINGGNTITLPYDATDHAASSITIEPKGNLVDPTFVFDSAIDSYFIEWVA